MVCHGFGPIDSLVFENRPSGECGALDVRVSVRAAGVNFVDALIVEGRYQVKPPLPYVPGSEAAGVVVEVGSSVDADLLGRRVAVNAFGGGYAEELIARAAQVVVVPGNMTDGQAATFAQSYLTAWFALVARARAVEGQSLLVLGAGSGVGLAAVDVGASLGLRVIAGASSEAKRAVAVAAGAIAVIDTTAPELKDRIRELSGGGVDLVYDPVGGELADPALRALADDGQFLVIGFASGAIPRLAANQVLLRNRRVTGVDWGGWAGKHVVENRRLLADVLAGIEAGRLHPVEPTPYPMSDAKRALHDLANRQVVGKIALVP